MDEYVGPYRILDRLGAGGMGEVYVAEDARLKRRIALKRLPVHVARDPVWRERFRREAEAVAALDHPNIVAIHSFETAHVGDESGDEIHFITMQLIEGGTLRDRIPDDGLDLDRFLELALPLSDALSAAHRAGIVHRDLKPDNIMVGDDGRLRVLDFGLAKFAPLRATPQFESGGPTLPSPLTSNGAPVGTVPYMAPEQIRGETIDVRADIFALGSILYEMAVGERPFRGSGAVETMSSILRDTPERVSRKNPGLPAALDDIIQHCLEKSRDDRYPSACELHEELQRLQQTTLGPIHSPNIAGTALPLPARPSLAILPFKNLSCDPEQESLAFGLWADLNADLVKISGLFLISQTSTRLYKDRPVVSAEAARELGVRFILEGSLRKSANLVRINVQLLDAQSGETRWAERYDRELGDLFSLQDEITSEIVTALDVTLVHGESHRIVQSTLKDPRARDTYYRALAGLLTFRRDEMLEARHLLREVESLEPESPLAHVFTAFGHYFEAKLGYSGARRESMRQAMAAADRAIELNDPTGTAFMIQGLVHLTRGRYDAALASSDLAVRDRPNCPWALALKGAVLNFSGRPASAIDVARRAIRHTPLSPPIFAALLTTSLYLCGRYDESIIAARGTLEMEPENLEARIFLAGAHVATGHPDQAVQVLKEIREVKPDFSLDEFVASQPYRDRTVLSDLVRGLEAAMGLV